MPNTKVKSLPISGANEVANLENNPQTAGFKTIDHLVRGSIVNTNGDSEQTIRHNIFMATLWYETMFPQKNPYLYDRARKVDIILIHLKENHGYVIAEQNTSGTN